MKLLLRNNLEDSVKLGILRTVLLAIVIDVVVVLISIIIVAIRGFAENWEALVIFTAFFGILGSLFASGITNGVFLIKRSFPKAGRVSLIIGLVVFLGACAYLIGAAISTS